MRLWDDLEQDHVAGAVSEQRQVWEDSLGVPGPIEGDQQGDPTVASLEAFIRILPEKSTLDVP